MPSLPQARLPSPTMTSSIVSSESVDRKVRRDPSSSETSEELLTKPTKITKSNKNENHEREREDPYYSDLPEWLQEFRENLVDDRVRERKDSHAIPSHGLSLEFARGADLGKQCFSHFPKDRTCEICQMTKITRAPCRRRIGRVVPRAEKFGDLITADHKVLSEGCESRNNYRYAVVVQDLATQWIQSYPCKTKTSQETQRSLQKFLEPNSKPLVIYIDLAKLVKIFLGIIVRRHHTDRKQMGLLREQYADWKKVLRLQYCCNQVWKNGGQIPWNAFLFLRNIQDLLSDGKTPYERCFGELFKWPIIPFGSLVEWLPSFCERPVKNPTIWKVSLTWIVPWIRIVRGKFGRVTYWSQTVRSWTRWTHRKSTQKDSMQRK